MFGHVAGRKRRSRWAILSFLFALALAWSFAAMREQTILWVGLSVGLGISLLITFVSSRRLRRARKNEERETQAEGQASEEASTDKRLTYEEVFQVQVNVDDASLAGVHEDEEWPAEVDEAMEIEAGVTEVEPVEALQVDDESHDALQRMREEFAARAKEAELRVKQREAELDEAASAPKSKS